MSKILSVLLLVANIGLFVLLQQQEARQQQNNLTPGGDIVLFSERPQATDERTASTDDPPQGPNCYSYGPLDSKLSAVGVMAQFKPVATTQVIREVAPGKQFWLFLDPASSVPSSEEAGDSEPKPEPEQVQVQVQETSLITQGELKGERLLEILFDEERLQTREQHYQAQGTKIRVEQRSIDRPQFWLDFGTQAQRVDPRALGLLSKQTLLIKRSQCPETIWQAPPSSPGG